MPSPRTSLRAAAAALAAALIVAPAAHASASGPAMSAAQVRSFQAQGVREIIVRRSPGLSEAEQAAIRAQAGVTYAGPGPLPNTELDRAPAGQLAAAVTKLERASQVQYAEPDGTVHATSIPNDPYFSQQWALLNGGQSVDGHSGTTGDDIGATYAWPHSTGTGVTVAVVDTGVDSTAPDLLGQLVLGYDFVNNDTNTQDQNGHGTHVSGIIAALQNNAIGVSGVAPGAHVMPLRVLDASGSGTDSAVAAAFNYAGDQGVPVVNASLGGSAPSQAIEQAVAAHPNTLYVVAAGNNRADDDATPFYPCDLPEANLICVGASDQNDEPASFSNHGSSSVDLFAPGVNILSTWLSAGGSPEYAYADGTSMATPMVSGTLALMLGRSSSLTSSQLKSDLLASVDREPQLAGLAATGGELDAAAAVATAGGDAPYAAPGNTTRPQIGGAAVEGQSLVADRGGWSRAPTSYSYQWERCSLGLCVPVLGATGASYTPTAGDLGASLAAVVTAANGAGYSQATSGPTAPVQPASGSGGSAAPAASGNSIPAPVGPTSGLTAGPRRVVVKLTHVAVRGRHGTRGGTLVFTLSTAARVQIAVGRSLRLIRSGRRGSNRLSLTALLADHSLRPGRYALTVRAGSGAVTLWMSVA